jgi:dienelactone hydrolase
MPTTLRFFLLAALAAIGCDRGASSARGATPAASSAPPPFAERSSVPIGDPTVVAFSSGALTLHGFLFRPPGVGPFPAIVFNHGSEPLPGPKTGQAEFYVRRGFVLFVPHRRGQGRSRDQGRPIGEYYDEKSPDSPAFVDELVRQTDDVMSAIAYVASLPYVDKSRIAAAGCSLGGIESLFAAERGDGIVAAIDFAGASMTWKTNAPLRERMTAAARNVKVPVLFLQAENDFDTTPSRVLSQEATRAGKAARAHIYPPNGSGPEDGHAFCAGGAEPPWGDEVVAFLKDAMRAR